MSETKTMTVDVLAPRMVYLAGLLLPHGSYQIEPSPVAPNVCDVVVVRDHPGLPASLRAALDAIPVDATELHPELQGGRVFMTIPGQGGAALFVELQLRNMKLVTTKPKLRAVE